MLVSPKEYNNLKDNCDFSSRNSVFIIAILTSFPRIVRYKLAIAVKKSKKCEIKVTTTFFTYYSLAEKIFNKQTNKQTKNNTDSLVKHSSTCKTPKCRTNTVHSIHCSFHLKCTLVTLKHQHISF